jgi:hypothetical protein
MLLKIISLNEYEHYKITPKSMGMFRPTINLHRRIIRPIVYETLNYLQDYLNTVKVTAEGVTVFGSTFSLISVQLNLYHKICMPLQGD